MNIITGKDNSNIKFLSALKDSRGIKKSGFFKVDSLKIILESIQMKRKMEFLFIKKSFFESNKYENEYKFIIDLFDENKIYIVDDLIWKNIKDTVNSQGMIGVFANSVIKSFNSFNKSDIRALYLDDIQDPGNMGTIIRSADAFSIDLIIVSKGSCDILNSKVVRSSMGSVFNVPILYDVTFDRLKEIIINNNLKMYSSSLDSNIFLKELKINGKSIFAIGNESKGISKQIIDISVETFKIEMNGDCESLNAAIAASVIMYQTMK